MSDAKSPWLAVILNLLIAGLGHIYLGLTKRGIVLFFLTAAVAAVSILISPLFRHIETLFAMLNRNVLILHVPNYLHEIFY